MFFFFFLKYLFPVIFINQGNQAFKEKQWPKAVALYSEAIKLSDKNATYYSNRAAAYLELRR